MSSSHFQYINNENVFQHFINGCESGDLELIKYCIAYANSINSPIDIHDDREYAFRLSCDNGHLCVVEYLINYTNSINSPIEIHINDEYAFCLSCQNGHSKIVEYLINYANSINSLLISMLTKNMLFVVVVKMDIQMLLNI